MGKITRKEMKLYKDTRTQKGSFVVITLLQNSVYHLQSFKNLYINDYHYFPIPKCVNTLLTVEEIWLSPSETVVLKYFNAYY